jgi:epoxyqueuosine reductase
VRRSSARRHGPPTEPPPALDELRELARPHGVTHLGVAPATVLDRARTALIERRDAGLHDGMQFTYRNPERSTDPGRAVAGARSVIVGAKPYLLDEPPAPDGIHARVARYAWVDHYEALRNGLWAVAHRLRADGWRAVVFADDNSVVDREMAYRAGLGWFGKSSNLLIEGAGSWFVLGSVVTDAPLPAAAAPVADGCGSCRRCVDACPTGAIIAPGVVDASRCLAWLLQKPGIFPREHRIALGNRIYGCDDCQEACPPTVRLGERFRGAAASGTVHDRTADASSLDATVDVLALLEGDDETILDRWGRWYLAGRDPRWLRRNALVVVGNGGQCDERVVAVLRAYLAHPDVILRAHAVWAARRLGLDELLPPTDEDPQVAAELTAAL